MNSGNIVSVFVTFVLYSILGLFTGWQEVQLVSKRCMERWEVVPQLDWQCYWDDTCQYHPSQCIETNALRLI